MSHNNMGWCCPGCGRCYAPHIACCGACQPMTIAVPWNPWLPRSLPPQTADPMPGPAKTWCTTTMFPPEAT